jgi:outer membrane protein OmpA-like peptidoglycan-associated protein
LGVYGDIGKGKYDIRGIVEGGHGTYESVREIGEVAKEIEIKEYGNIEVGKATGKFGATYIGMDVEGGMNFSVLNRKFGVRPYVGIEGKINKYEQMKEEGVGVFALRMKEGIYNRILGRLGVMVEQERTKYDWNVKLEYKRLMSSGEPEILGINVRYKISSNIGVTLGATLKVSDTNRNIEGLFGVGYKFGRPKTSKQNKITTNARNTSAQRKSITKNASGQKKAITNVKQKAVTNNRNEQIPSLEFLLNSTKITPKTQKILDSIVTKLKKYPNSQLVLTGHTDSVGEMKCNKNLSLRRSLSVQKLLRNKMQILGLGSRKPIASNKTPQGRQKNRRATISIQPNKKVK